MSKKIIFTSICLTLAMLLGCLLGCSDSSDNKSTDEETEYVGDSGIDSKRDTGDTSKSTGKQTEEALKETEVSPTVYDADVIKSASATAAGSFNAWKNQVKNGNEHNNAALGDSIIESPFHTLKVNGKTVPVYTARCGKGAHSFAWVDVSGPTEFALDVTLTLSEDFGKCVVLPESRKTDVQKSGRQIKSVLKSEGSYTYTFAKSQNAETTDPEFAPITIMVTRKNTVKIPRTYKTQYIEPGYHGDDELKFTQQNTAYVMKKGFHQISSIGLPSNSILIIEQGAYLQAADRKNGGSYNGDPVINTEDTTNVKIISRGLLDCGLMQGGDTNHKAMITIRRAENVILEGLTVINSNSWTVNALSSNDVDISRNLLLGYRMYSDGIMMSGCVDSIGHHNFVRTGDDGIEFKGTHGNTGENCVYEYNDVWSDKGVCYGIIYESVASMKNMTFRNNSIGFAQSDWEARLAAIDCHLGTSASSKWSNVTFEDFEIYHVKSPNVLSVRVVEDGGIFENITFKNITVKSVAPDTHAFRMHFDAAGGSISGIVLENISFCGTKLKATDKSNSALFLNEAPDYFNKLTVK